VGNAVFVPQAEIDRLLAQPKHSKSKSRTSKRRRNASRC
jgi:hypothetical protein